MILPKLKLKNQLAIINTLSKLLIILIAVFIIPWLVSKISINDTDQLLFNKIDQVYVLIDSLGIEEFIDTESYDAFGSYNILKDEYISIEPVNDMSLYEYIEYSQRIIEDEVYDYRVLSATFELDGSYYLIEIGKSISTIINFEKKLNRFAFYFLLVVLTLSILFDLSITQLLLRPFESIINKLKSTNHPTSFDYTPVKTITSDFQYLEESIHSLMHKIAAAFSDEREYISNVSHELLTPISIIQSKLDNILNESEIPDNEIIKILDSKVTLGRLTRIVKTLLLMSRIENEEYLLQDKISIDIIIYQVIDEIKERIEAKELTLNLDICKEKYFFSGNENLSHILFFNLINNSIKYTDNQGNISIKSYVKNSNYCIEVTDTGKGISEEHLPHIFSRFKKFQDGNNNFGLGLALVKKICDYHKINIIVKSEINNGTTFHLQLP